MILAENGLKRDYFTHKSALGFTQGFNFASIRMQRFKALFAEYFSTLNNAEAAIYAENGTKSDHQGALVANMM